MAGRCLIKSLLTNMIGLEKRRAKFMPPAIDNNAVP
jgi:hypothetical protein